MYILKCSKNRTLLFEWYYHCLNWKCFYKLYYIISKLMQGTTHHLIHGPLGTRFLDRPALVPGSLSQAWRWMIFKTRNNRAVESRCFKVPIGCGLKWPVKVDGPDSQMRAITNVLFGHSLSKTVHFSSDRDHLQILKSWERIGHEYFFKMADKDVDKLRTHVSAELCFVAVFLCLWMS